MCVCVVRLKGLQESFSVADVAVGSYLLYVPLFFPDISVAKWPNIQSLGTPSFLYLFTLRVI